MNISNNIHELRKERGMTQSELAEKLGVSEQAVSKWENDVCSPDVSLFPVIASVFNVSIDRIFGYHTHSYEDEVKSILLAYEASMDTYREIEIATEGLKRYPNSPELKVNLAFSLAMLYRISSNETEKKNAVEKAISLCCEVLDNCDDTEQINSAANMLRRIYVEIGEYEKALKIIDRLSPDAFSQRLLGISAVLYHKGDHEALIKVSQKNIWECWLSCDLMFEKLECSFIRNGEFDKAIEYCNAHLKLLSSFDCGCNDFYATHKMWAEHRKAKCLMKLGDRVSCLDTISSLVEHIKDVKRVELSESFDIANRNPMYFSCVYEEYAKEEYMNNLNTDNLLSCFDSFFGNDENYLHLKNQVK